LKILEHPIPEEFFEEEKFRIPPEALEGGGPVSFLQFLFLLDFF
jgi:hypothetical protein